MNTKGLIAAGVLVGLVEVVFLVKPELWDDFVYSLKGIPEWMQSRNGWLSKPPPPKN
jgi:hypothetical protein